MGIRMEKTLNKFEQKLVDDNLWLQANVTDFKMALETIAKIKCTGKENCASCIASLAIKKWSKQI